MILTTLFFCLSIAAIGVGFFFIAAGISLLRLAFRRRPVAPPVLPRRPPQ